MPDDDEEVIDTFLEQTKTSANERYNELRGRRATEMKLWHQWDAGGRQEHHLEPLLKSIKPVVASEARRRMQGLGGSIPRAALEHELLTHAVGAIHSYDPTFVSKTGRTTQLNTHIHNNFQRVTDFVAGRRNMARLPKAKTERYAVFNNAHTEFQQEFGREPSTSELHGMLPQWSAKEIGELQNAFAPEAFSSVSELEHDPGMGSDVHRSAVVLMKSQFKPEELAFAEHHYPAFGKKPKTVQQIAKAMGIPEHKAYRIRTRVDNIIAPIVKES